MHISYIYWNLLSRMRLSTNGNWRSTYHQYRLGFNRVFFVGGWAYIPMISHDHHGRTIEIDPGRWMHKANDGLDRHDRQLEVLQSYSCNFMRVQAYAGQTHEYTWNSELASAFLCDEAAKWSTKCCFGRRWRAARSSDLACLGFVSRTTQRFAKDWNTLQGVPVYQFQIVPSYFVQWWFQNLFISMPKRIPRFCSKPAKWSEWENDKGRYSVFNLSVALGVKKYGDLIRLWTNFMIQ